MFLLWFELSPYEPRGAPCWAVGWWCHPLPCMAQLARKLLGLVTASAVLGGTREGENLIRAGCKDPVEAWGTPLQLSCPPPVL